MDQEVTTVISLVDYNLLFGFSVAIATCSAIPYCQRRD